jgi:ubiquinol-cytochrome c reductase cytochrome b subunit
VPPVVFYVVRRWCIGLQRADNERLLHGYETGIVIRSPEGGYSERHLPLEPDRALALSSREPIEVSAPPSVQDDRGVRRPGARAALVRSRLSLWVHGDDVPPPTHEELQAAHRHRATALQRDAGVGQPASGHEFDDHTLRDADKVPLRGGDDLAT